ncbi:MAG: MFS transporter [Acidimicrobiia bacterium]|nr:MFS transporter [Acidimicrobiia bacterium]
MTTSPRTGDRSSTDDGDAGRSRWLVLGAVSAVYAAFGFVVAVTAALVTPISTDLGLSSAQMGLVLGAWQFSYIGMSIPAGRVVDRFGARFALTVAGLVIMVSALGRAVATGFPTLLGAAAVLGVGAPLVSVGAPAVAASLFSGKDRRRAVAMYSTAPSTGTMLGLFLPGSVLGPLLGDNWRLAALSAALVAALAVAAWIPASANLDRTMTPGTGPALADYVAIAGQPVVRIILVLAALTFFVMHGTGQWMVAIIESSGRPPAQAGRWATLAAAVVLTVSVVVPQLASPRRRRLMLIGAALTGSLAVHGLTATQPLVLLPSILAVGWARAGLVPLFMLILMDDPDVGPARMAAASSLFFTVAQLGGVSGPVVTGLLADASGDPPVFTTALVVHSMVLLSLAATVAFGIPRPAAQRLSGRLALSDD